MASGLKFAVAFALIYVGSVSKIAHSEKLTMPKYIYTVHVLCPTNDCACMHLQSARNNLHMHKIQDPTGIHVCSVYLSCELYCSYMYFQVEYKSFNFFLFKEDKQNTDTTSPIHAYNSL